MISEVDSWNLVLVADRTWLRITGSATLACTNSRIVSLVSVPSSFLAADGGSGTAASGEGFASSFGGTGAGAGWTTTVDAVGGACGLCRCVLLHHPPSPNTRPNPMPAHAHGDIFFFFGSGGGTILLESRIPDSNFCRSPARTLWTSCMVCQRWAGSLRSARPIISSNSGGTPAT